MAYFAEITNDDTSASFKPSSPADIVTKVFPALMNNQGQWTPFNAAAQLYDTLEFRTTATPAVSLDVAHLDDPAPNPYLEALKPTFIFTGPLGRSVVAPYGVAPAGAGVQFSIGLLLAVGIGMTGVGFLLGKNAERKARRARVVAKASRR